MSYVAPALTSSDRQDWRTPPCVLDLVRRLAPIALDPCTDVDNPTGASAFYTPPCDGLAQDWRKDAAGGLVFMNCPYGGVLPAWAEKASGEGNAKGVEVITLTPARTDTRWFQDHIATAPAICFWRGRIKFVGAKDAAPFPSAVAYFGPRPALFAEVFSRAGWVVQQ